MLSDVSDDTARLAEPASGMSMVTSTATLPASSRRPPSRNASETRLASARTSPAATAMTSLRASWTLTLKDASGICSVSDRRTRAPCTAAVVCGPEIAGPLLPGGAGACAGEVEAN